MGMVKLKCQSNEDPFSEVVKEIYHIFEGGGK